jgi:hypothetical protein
MINVSNKQFKSQKQLKAFVKEMLSEPRLVNKEDEDYEFLSEFIKRHHDYDNKVSGEGELVFKVSKDFAGNPTMFLLKGDKETDISWAKSCINGLKRTSKEGLRRAMRGAISQQILDFKFSSAARKVKSCPVCESPIQHLEGVRCFDIDHVGVPFSKLASDFEATQSYTPAEFDDSKGLHNYAFKQEDEQWSKEWEEYHKENATLRILCSECNCRLNNKSYYDSVIEWGKNWGERNETAKRGL